MKRNFFLPRFRRKKKLTSDASAGNPPKKRASSSDDGPGAPAKSATDTAANQSAFAATFEQIVNRPTGETVLTASHGMGRTVHFFHRGARDSKSYGGGYFTVHGEAAVALAALYRENINRNAAGELESMNLNHKLLRRVLRSLLLRKRCKVEIWDRAEGSLSSSGGGGSDGNGSGKSASNVVGQWKMAKRASPASFGDVKELLFHPRDALDESDAGPASRLDQSLFAAEAASCMSLSVHNTRLDCGCTCAEVHVAVANTSHRFLGAYTSKIYWNAAESSHCPNCKEHVVPAARRLVYRNLGMLMTHYDIRECVVPSDAMWESAVQHSLASDNNSNSSGDTPAVSPSAAALTRIALAIAAQMELHHVVVTLVPVSQFKSDGSQDRILLTAHITADTQDQTTLSKSSEIQSQDIHTLMADPRASGGMCALLRYLQVSPPTSVASPSLGASVGKHGGKVVQFRLQNLVWDAYMRLNEDVLRTLCVFVNEEGSGGDGVQAQPVVQSGGSLSHARGNAVPKTLFALLSAPCVTTVGPPLLIGWLRKPLQSQAKICERLNVVDFFVQNPEILSDLRRKPALKGTPNLSALAHAFRRRKAGLKTMILVYGFCSNLRHVVDLLLEHADTGRASASTESEQASGRASRHDDDADAGDLSDVDEEDAAMAIAKSLGILVSQLQRVVADLGSFERLVEASIDVPEYHTSGRLQISASLHPRLKRLATQMKEAHADIQREKEAVAKILKMDVSKLRVDLAHGSTARYGAGPSTSVASIAALASATGGQVAFRVTKTYDKNLRSSKQNKMNFTVLARQKDGIHFVSNELLLIGNRLRSCAQEYQSIQLELQRKAVEVAATFVPVLEDAASAIAKLDVLQAFAHLSISSSERYVRAKVGSWGGSLILKGSRHPLLEVQGGIECISNDASLSDDVGRLQIITGPNMGGKSTFIRQIAITVLLTHIGCHVPCESATVPLVDGIFSRVGSADNSQGGVSTFMAEMLAAQTILSEASSKSLVIIDEIGRGTCVADGCGLAWAIARHIADDIGCYCYFATHFHELTCLATRKTFQLPNNPCVSDEEAIDDDTSSGPNVGNLFMSSHTTADTITMLYEVRPGVCLDSLGLHCAQMAGFPEAVLDEARRWKNSHSQQLGITSDGSSST